MKSTHVITYVLNFDRRLHRDFDGFRVCIANTGIQNVLMNINIAINLFSDVAKTIQIEHVLFLMVFFEMHIKS